MPVARLGAHTTGFSCIERALRGLKVLRFHNNIGILAIPSRPQMLNILKTKCDLERPPRQDLQRHWSSALCLRSAEEARVATMMPAEG